MCLYGMYVENFTYRKQEKSEQKDSSFLIAVILFCFLFLFYLLVYTHTRAHAPHTHIHAIHVFIAKICTHKKKVKHKECKFCSCNSSRVMKRLVPQGMDELQLKPCNTNWCVCLQEIHHVLYDVWISFLQLAVHCRHSRLCHLLVLHIYLQLLERQRHPILETNTWVWQY